MGELGATLEAVGPMVASVAASMVSRLAVLKVPRLLRSNDTVRGAPRQLAIYVLARAAKRQAMQPGPWERLQGPFVGVTEETSKPG
jgi:hypothetical protein